MENFCKLMDKKKANFCCWMYSWTGFPLSEARHFPSSWKSMESMAARWTFSGGWETS